MFSSDICSWCSRFGKGILCLKARVFPKFSNWKPEALLWLDCGVQPNGNEKDKFFDLVSLFEKN